MIIKELIEKLSKFDPELDVIVETESYARLDIDNIHFEDHTGSYLGRKCIVIKLDY